MRRGDFKRLDFVPMSRISVLSVFNLRRFIENQDFISSRQSEREEGWRVESGLVEI